jgi:outer membrane protein assembly factor BamD (BamD/ComL family)
VALVIRGDLAAWRGVIDSAQAFYAKVAAVPGSTAANDALDRLLILQLADQDSAAVATMRQADKLAATGKTSAAAETYRAAASTARDGELRDRCNLSAAEQFMTIGQDTTAMTLLDAIIADVPETIFGDRALFRKAELALRRKDVSSAVDALTILLVQYPRSIFVPDARERIRALRGDS